MWIGNRHLATKFVIFFHGGGFMAPLRAGHLNWCWNAYVTKGDESEVAVAVLQYSLAPDAKYPTQLRQAVSAVNHLLNHGIDPRNVILGGDSAGGNLAVQLLCHISHPKIGIEAVRLHKRRFAGVFLVSPWVSGETSTRSFRDNDDVDMLSKTVVKKTQEQVLLPEDAVMTQDLPNAALPLDGNRRWFCDVQEATEAMYITAGSLEVFRDSICAFGEAMRIRNPEMLSALDIFDDQVHDSILLEGEHDVVGNATEKMQEWASSRLNNKI
jgi:acetyl esterase/lipase